MHNISYLNFYEPFEQVSGEFHIFLVSASMGINTGRTTLSTWYQLQFLWRGKAILTNVVFCVYCLAMV